MSKYIGIDKTGYAMGRIEGVAENATTTDCISRQQAIEALIGWQTEPLDEDIKRTLENLPPVTPTERTGEWIRDRYWSRGTGMGEEYGFFYKCSLCDWEVEGGYTRCGFNFCPHCGAKMKG